MMLSLARSPLTLRASPIIVPYLATIAAVPQVTNVPLSFRLSRCSFLYSQMSISNNNAKCPVGLEWVAKRKGHKNKFGGWVTDGQEVWAVITRKDDASTFQVKAEDIRAYGEQKYSTLLNKRAQTDRVNKDARAKVRNMQNILAYDSAKLDQLSTLVQDLKDSNQDQRRDAAEVQTELGGTGVQPPIPEPDAPKAPSGECMTCRSTFTKGISFHRCCGTWLSCVDCTTKREECPGCRGRPMPTSNTSTAEATGAQTDEEDDGFPSCGVCGDNTSSDNNLLIRCQQGSCTHAMHQNCMMHPPGGNLDDRMGWCPAHWPSIQGSRREKTDFQLIGNDAGGTTASASANIIAATTPQAREERYRKREEASQQRTSIKKKRKKELLTEDAFFVKHFNTIRKESKSLKVKDLKKSGEKCFAEYVAKWQAEHGEED